MTRPLQAALRASLCATLLTGCWLGPPIRGDVELDLFPPAWFIATAFPFYFEGHSSYWYGNQWYYRDGGNWRSYRTEPGALRAARMSGGGARQYYGRGHAGNGRRR